MKTSYLQFNPIGLLNEQSVLIPCKEGSPSVSTLLKNIDVLNCLKKVDSFLGFAEGKIQTRQFGSDSLVGDFSFEFAVDLKNQPPWLQTLLSLNLQKGTIKLVFSFQKESAFLKELNFSCREILHEGKPGNHFEKPIDNLEASIKSLSEYLLSIFKQTYIVAQAKNLFDFSSLKNDLEFKKVLKEASTHLHTISKMKWEIYYSTELNELVVDRGNSKVKLKEVSEAIKWNTLLAILTVSAKVEAFKEIPLIILQWPEKFVDKVILKTALESFVLYRIPYIVLTESPEVLATHSKLKGRMLKLAL